ncbi:MAG: hypothetical protein LBM74_10450 [Oscillospiraceae bacterium]|jgi:hypothetical protein|nr:hypothetical protein [Oscillospiraceae bacterium]
MKRIIALVLVVLCACATPLTFAQADTIRILEAGIPITDNPVTVIMVNDVVMRKPAGQPIIDGVSYTDDTFAFSKTFGASEKHTPQSRAFEHFAPLHPGFSIQRYWEDDILNYERLYTQWLTGTLEADMLHYWNLALNELYENGLLVDLATHAPLMEAIQTRASIMHLLGDGEHLFAFPTRFYPKTLHIMKPDVYETLQPLPDDETWLWSDLFALADAVEAYNEQHDPDIYLLRTAEISPTWLRQYIHNEAFASDGAPPDEAALRALLASWKDLYDRDLVIFVVDMIRNQIEPNRCLFAEMPLFSLLVAQQDGIVLPPVYRQGIARTEIDASYYVINAASPYVQECLDLLTLMADSEIYLQSSDIYDYGWPPEGHLNAQSRYPWIINPKTGEREGVSPETNAQWNEIIRTGYTLNGSELYAAVQEVYAAFMADQIGLEECVQQILGRINMLMGES